MKNPFTVTGETTLLVLAGIALAGFLLTGCTSKRPHTPPPPPQPPAPLVEAQRVEDPAPEPFQAPRRGSLIDDLPADVAEATKLYMKSGKAKVIDRRTDGFAMYPYGLTRPKVQCKVFDLCSIELEPGERMTENGLILGDTVRWWAGKLVHGEGEHRTETLTLKPNDNIPGLRTSATIGTTRRKYVVEAIYGTKQTVNLKFYYPEQTIKNLNAQQEQQQEQDKPVVASGPGLDITNLHMNYHIECNGARFCPTWVADDGSKTYILLPEGLESIGIPSMFVELAGENQIVNYNTSKLPYYILERVADRIILQMGTTDGGQRVVITREG